MRESRGTKFKKKFGHKFLSPQKEMSVLVYCVKCAGAQAQFIPYSGKFSLVPTIFRGFARGASSRNFRGFNFCAGLAQDRVRFTRAHPQRASTQCSDRHGGIVEAMVRGYHV